MRANVVMNKARSGADLFVPRQGAGVVQSARPWIIFDDFDVESDDEGKFGFVVLGRLRGKDDVKEIIGGEMAFHFDGVPERQSQPDANKIGNFLWRSISFVLLTGIFFFFFGYSYDYTWNDLISLSSSRVLIEFLFH